MELQCPNVGHVDDVQELRRTRPRTVPERYVRDCKERPTPATSDLPPSPCMQLPIIDLFELIVHPNKEQLAKLNDACKNWGFFYVVNHGIDHKLLQDMEKQTKEFFMLPLEEKEKHAMAPGTVQGYGHALVFSDDQKLDWCNMLALAVEPKPYVRIPQLWPDNPPKFSETIEHYSKQMTKLCKRLLRFVAMSLNLSSEEFNVRFGSDTTQAVRMNYYPPCSRPDLVLGLSSHSDGGSLTVLQQDMSFAGLHVLKNNTWVPVNPIKGALVVNIGDIIEILTNGVYKSVQHRAVTSIDKSRLSIATFYAPSFDTILGPMREFVDDDHPRRYRSLYYGEYSVHYVTNKLDGKKSLDFCKI